jgi:hypothetical protein
VAFLRHLDEFDRRRSYVPLGYSSLFQYCRGELALSEDETCLRTLAARRSREFPQILDMLGSGELHLSGLARLSPHLRPDTVTRLLDAARGKSRREIERLAAGLGKAAPRADTIRFLAPHGTAPAGALGTEQVQLALSPGANFPTPVPAQESSRPEPPSPPPVAAEPDAPAPAPEAQAPGQGKAPASSASCIAPEDRLVRISFTASEELLLKIERTRALLRHKHPAGHMEQLMGEAFDALLARLDPARPIRPRPACAGTKVGARSRRIPRWVRAEVWRRDGGRCAYVSPEGRRCQATEWLEYDHITPYALGGCSKDPAGIRLLCKVHNTLAARQAFGTGPWRRTGKRGGN